MNSDFAKRQLEKHGWTEGDGLGRKRDGKSAPIKVNIKMDKTGVGHDPGKEFTDHWWMKAFNDAAKKIKNADEKPDTKEETEETKGKAEMSERKKNFYKGFVKGTTLTNGCETKDSDHSSSGDEDSDGDENTSVPTLDDLHKFCGGATGHKAARFGIKMKGKLDRVAAHDKQFEEMSKIEPGISYVKKKKDKANEKLSSHQTEVSSESSDSSDQGQKTGKKDEEENHIQSDSEPAGVVETAERKKKKKRKKDKNTEEEKEGRNEVKGKNLMDDSKSGVTERTERKEKKKKMEVAAEETTRMDEVTLMETNNTEANTKKKKKKKKKGRDEDEKILTNGDVEDEKRNEKRKRKHESSVYEIPETINGIDNNVASDSHVCSTALIDDDDLEKKMSRKKKKKLRHSDNESIQHGESLDNSTFNINCQSSEKQFVETDVLQDVVPGDAKHERKKKKKNKENK